MTLSIIDLIIVLLYFFSILYIGFFVSKKNSTPEKDEFLLAGRKLTLPLFVGSLVATWYGSILGIGEFVYNSGIVAWVCFGLPYYIAAALFATFIAGKIRTAGFSSIPEQITHYYGEKNGIIAAIIILVITIPAAYMLMLGIIVQLFTGWGLAISISIGAILSLIYLFTGGFRADVYTNSAQFVLMYVGFAVLFIFAFINYGSPETQFVKLPNHHLQIFGDLNWQYVLSWYIIAFQTFVDPSFHQRCAAARSPKIAQKGVFISILFWAIFDFLTLSVGLYAKANLEDISPIMAFPLLGEAVLPPIWKGIFVVSLLAIIMSTLNSYSFISGVTIGKDIISKLSKKMANKNEIKLINTGLLISSFFAVILAIWIPSAVDLIYKTSSIAVPGLIIPLTFTYFKRQILDKKQVLIIMVITSLFALLCSILKSYQVIFFVDFEPMFLSIIFALLLTFILMKTKNEYI